MKKTKNRNRNNTSLEACRLRQYRRIYQFEKELQELSHSIARNECACPGELMAYTLGSSMHINRRGSISLLLRGTSVLYFSINGWKQKSGLLFNIKMLFYRCRARIPLYLSGLI